MGACSVNAFEDRLDQWMMRLGHFDASIVIVSPSTVVLTFSPNCNRETRMFLGLSCSIVKRVGLLLLHVIPSSGISRDLP